MPSKKKPAKKKKQPAKKKKAAPKKAASAPVMRTLTPTCAVKAAGDAVALYEKVFGAKVLDRFTGPDGSLAHAEVAVGDSVFMIGEPMGEATTMALAIRVKDAKEVWQKALGAGCTVIYPLEDQFYGELSGRVRDPYGNQWAISSRTEEVSRAEMEKRFQKMMRGEPWR